MSLKKQHKSSPLLEAIRTFMCGKSKYLVCPATGKDIPVYLDKEEARNYHPRADGPILEWMGYVYVSTRLTNHSVTPDIHVFKAGTKEHIGYTYFQGSFERYEE